MVHHPPAPQRTAPLTPYGDELWCIREIEVPARKKAAMHCPRTGNLRGRTQAGGLPPRPPRVTSDKMCALGERGIVSEGPHEFIPPFPLGKDFFAPSPFLGVVFCRF